ncbi:hypothetical protein GCM10020295_19180 [Streptomyces cinereospinus]
MARVPTALAGRHFLKELDFTASEFLGLVELAAELKAAKKAGTETPRLRGRAIALIFEKTSTRTRCAFEVAAADQGAATTYLDPAGSQIGHKESVKDTARVLGRMYDAIEYRGDSQAKVEELAAHAGVPVYNGLTDDWHPTQMLADVLTMTEHGTGPLAGTAYAYLGDARFNMGNSYLVTGALLGMDVRIVAPGPTGPPRRSSTGPARSPGPAVRGSPSPRTWPRACAAPASSPPTSGSPWASPRRSGTSGSPRSRRTP